MKVFVVSALLLLSSAALAQNAPVMNNVAKIAAAPAFTVADKASTLTAANAACAASGSNLINTEQYVAIYFDESVTAKPFYSLQGVAQLTWVADAGADDNTIVGLDTSNQPIGIEIPAAIASIEKDLAEGKIAQDQVDAAKTVLADLKAGIAAVCVK